MKVLSDWLAQRLERNAATPLYRQLHRLLQHAIVAHDIAAGTRLPSSRTLAIELNIARNTVTQVYEQLVLEGYATSAGGSGTYVADTSPDEIEPAGTARARTTALGTAPRSALARAGHSTHATGTTRTTGTAGTTGTTDTTDATGTGTHSIGASPRLSTRGTRLVTAAGFSKRQWGAFMPGVPDVTKFPTRVWTRLQNRLWRNPAPELMTYAPGGGHPPLKQVLADYLRTARSVRCTPEQIVITTGIHQSVDLAVRLLTDPDDTVWIEDPCYWGVRSVLQVAGLRLRPVRVDDEGIAPGPSDLADAPKLIFVTPSHQYPLGTVMSFARRRMLLEYARQTGSWIIEDDYDSEFRYGTRPLASLQGLDGGEQVIYVGSFGKVLFPGLRIGYLVVPETLAQSFATASAELYREGQSLQQAVLAAFIAEGHFTSHIRKMRQLYGTRRELLLGAIRHRYGDALEVIGGDAGLHLVLRTPDAIDDTSLAARVLAEGVAVRPLSGYYSDATRAARGLLLGYACVPDDTISPSFEIVADVLDRR